MTPGGSGGTVYGGPGRARSSSAARHGLTYGSSTGTTYGSSGSSSETTYGSSGSSSGTTYGSTAAAMRPMGLKARPDDLDCFGTAGLEALSRPLATRKARPIAIRIAQGAIVAGPALSILSLAANGLQLWSAGWQPAAITLALATVTLLWLGTRAVD